MCSVDSRHDRVDSLHSYWEQEIQFIPLCQLTSQQECVVTHTHLVHLPLLAQDSLSLCTDSLEL